MHFLEVQSPMAHELSVEQQDRDFVAVAPARSRVCVDVDDIDAHAGGLRQGLQFSEHLVAKTAIGPRIQQEACIHRVHRRLFSAASTRCRSTT